MSFFKIKKMNVYYILKPKKLNLEYLVKKYQPDFKIEIEKAYLIIYLIIKLGNKKNNSKKVELSSKMLERLIGKEYHKYIDFFLENYFGDGNILHGFPYSKKHPFSYKLTEYYFKDGFELLIINDIKLINKYKSIFIKSKTNEQIRRYYYFLLKHFTNKKLTVYNPFEAIEHTNDLEPEKRLKNALNLISFLNEEQNLSLNTKTDGRVHSNITRLSKKSRDYLQSDGEFLAEIDISSSVPYFLFVTMNHYLNHNLFNLNKFQYNSNTYLFTYIFDEVTGDIDKSELQKFGEYILNGQLYEKFSELILSKELYESEGKDYSKVIKYYQYKFEKLFGYYFDGNINDLIKFTKKEMLSMLFAPTSLYKFEQIVFKKLFPTILKFINEFKDVQQYKDSEDIKWTKEDSHKKLSYFCFQLEAKSMIDNIAKDFDKLHKGKIPIFTLHDCILIKSSYAEELKEFMNMKFIQMFGIAPNLTLKYSKFYIENRFAS
jgi:hypothetical protein